MLNGVDTEAEVRAEAEVHGVQGMAPTSLGRGLKQAPVPDAEVHGRQGRESQDLPRTTNILEPNPPTKGRGQNIGDNRGGEIQARSVPQ